MTDQLNQPVSLSNQYETNAKRTIHVPSYRSALQGPVASLTSTSSDRPDVASVAILGYN